MKRGIAKAITELEEDKKNTLLTIKNIVDEDASEKSKKINARDIYDITKANNLLIYENNEGQWEFRKIEERYSF